jgi:hypothetical protein
MTTWWRPRRVIRARARRWSHRGIPWCCSYKLLQSTRGLMSLQQWRQKIMKSNVSSYKNIVWKNPTKGYSSAETHVVEPWAWVHIKCSVIRECNRKRLTGENLWTSLVAKPQCTLLLAEKDESKEHVWWFGFLDRVASAGEVRHSSRQLAALMPASFSVLLVTYLSLTIL